MKKLSIKALAWLLMLCMIVSIVPINAFATDGAESLQSENFAADSVINTEEELAAAVVAGGQIHVFIPKTIYAASHFWYSCYY